MCEPIIFLKVQENIRDNGDVQEEERTRGI